MGSYYKKKKKVNLHKRVQVLRVMCSAAAYMLVLVLGVRIGGAVDAKAAFDNHVAAVMATQEVSHQLSDEAALDSYQILSARAEELSLNYEDAWQNRVDEAAKAKGNVSTTGTAPVWQQPTGVFNASAYGYSGKDKIPYWRSINSDVMGYLRVPGTNISWPIVQNTVDVNYYTHRGYYHEDSFNGVIWTNPGTRSGSYSDLSSNTVIYGHNWTNYSSAPRVGYSGDVMFAQLTGYHYLSTAQSYPYFYYSTPQEEFTVAIFACFYTELGFAYNVPEGDMNYIINEAKRRSRHSFNIDVNSSDKIVTLSTCTRAYGSTSNQRFVVMGRILRPGETIGPVTVTSNYGHKQPSVW
ncbi:MAG: class B sortase [Angelakisella sp.]|nr:class B sortase [Angelakisella sp.]